MTISDEVRRCLGDVAAEYGTPCYVYFWDHVEQQVQSIRSAFGDRFTISYAVKANPNPRLLEKLDHLVELFDVSSLGELKQLSRLGIALERVTFSGPAKSESALQQAVAGGCEIVCESIWELETLNQIARDAGQVAQILIRVNPLNAPKGFAVSMAKSASQFGIDEEVITEAMHKLSRWKHLDLVGFHVYSGTNLLDEAALIEHFQILLELFRRLSSDFAVKPKRLVFGAAFGIPYEPQFDPLNLEPIAEVIGPAVDRLKQEDHFRATECVLETGRYIIGPAGYYLVSVMNEKESRGKSILICDGGMHQHLAACNLMGSIIRRNWPMWKVNETDDDELTPQWLVGPLCTTIDTLAYDIDLPRLSRGDVVAVGSSGAYGLTSSPIRFISHTEPPEVLVEGRGAATRTVDISVSHEERARAVERPARECPAEESSG